MKNLPTLKEKYKIGSLIKFHRRELVAYNDDLIKTKNKYCLIIGRELFFDNQYIELTILINGQIVKLRAFGHKSQIDYECEKINKTTIKYFEKKYKIGQLYIITSNSFKHYNIYCGDFALITNISFELVHDYYSPYDDKYPTFIALTVFCKGIIINIPVFGIGSNYDNSFKSVNE